MSRILLVFLSVLTCAGCVWAPQSDRLEPDYVNTVNYSVHQTIERHLDGSWDTTTVVWPTALADYYYGTVEFSDSVHYIIVNGDTAYRHLNHTAPPNLDSTVKYYIDGTPNQITLIFPGSSRTDTTFESGMIATITSPQAGDTLNKDSTINFDYNADIYSADNRSLSIIVTDSSHNVSETFYPGLGTVSFNHSEFSRFRTGVIWSDLRVSKTNYVSYDRKNVTILDRIMPYILK